MLNRHTGSQHGKNKKNAPLPPQSKDISVDQSKLVKSENGGYFYNGVELEVTKGNPILLYSVKVVLKGMPSQ